MISDNKTLFLVPDGVGIRNYLYSDIIKLVKKESEIWIWSPLPVEAFKDVKTLHDIKLNYNKLILHPEGFLTRIYRESATYARLIINAKNTDNLSILTNWNNKSKTLKKFVLNFLAQRIGKWASIKESRILKLEALAKAKWSITIVNNYVKQLEALKPKKIFITHQRVSALMPICIAAQKLGIEVISVIYSWDNLPKARLAIEANKYLVWSQYMKDEMHLFYPEIQKEKVLVSGTPQFEFYNQKDRIVERTVFAKQFGLNSSKSWICFSGDDIKTSPYDSTYLEDVASAISQMEENNRPQIIFRRCPVDFSNRYDKVLNKYKSIITPINPIWNTPKSGQNWGFVFPKYEDINMQVNIAFHCELVINLGSTMAHDFAIFNKPCLYINYDTVVDENWSVKTIYSYQHFRSMKGLEAVGWLNSPKHIKIEIEKVLNNPLLVGKDKAKWLEKIILMPVSQASINIANLLNE